LFQSGEVEFELELEVEGEVGVGVVDADGRKCEVNIAYYARLVTIRKNWLTQPS